MKSTRDLQRLAFVIFIVIVVFLAVSTLAEQPAQPTQSAPQEPPAIPTTGFPGLDQYRASRIAMFTDDFGQLTATAPRMPQLKRPKRGEDRVVFFGDSITDIWHLDEYFPGKPYVNRGIGGQTTPQMLVRFRQDVINLRPKVVVILAGTNDIAGNTGPMRLEDIEADYASMAELARANNIKMIYSSVLPVHNYTEKVERFFCAAAAGEDSCAEQLAAELLRTPGERLHLSGLFQRHGRHQGNDEEGPRRRWAASERGRIQDHGADGGGGDRGGAGSSLSVSAHSLTHPGIGHRGLCSSSAILQCNVGRCPATEDPLTARLLTKG